MELTITLLEELKQTLMRRATECGKDIKTLVEEMVESHAERANIRKSGLTRKKKTPPASGK